jgi:EMC6
MGASDKKSIWATLKQAATLPSDDNAAEEMEWGKEEVLDAVYWGRQLLALLLGSIFGSISFTGLTAFLTFMGIIIGSVLIWINLQRIDAEEFEGGQQLYNEGLGPAVALFLLSWIISYSFVSA